MENESDSVSSEDQATRTLPRTALITGASRNIGRIIATRFADKGISIGVNARSMSQEMAESLEQYAARGGDAIPLIGDVSCPDDVSRMFGEMRQEFGSVDCLVMAAAVRYSTAIEDISDREWTEVLHTNLFGPFYCLREAIPQMEAQHYGRVIAISGTAAGRVPGPSGHAHVAASKAGLEGLIYAVSRDSGSHGVTANIVAPGPVTTVAGKDLLYQSYAGRLASCDDVANACLLLASRQAGYLNGQRIVLDGGGIERLQPAQIAAPLETDHG